MRRFAHFSKFLVALASSVAMILGISLSASAAPSLVSTIPAVSSAQSVVLAPDGSRLYVMSRLSKELQVFDAGTNTSLGTYTLSSVTSANVQYMVISPDGKTLYLSGYNTGPTLSSVFVVDVSGATPTVSGSITIGQESSGLALTPDGSKLYATNAKDNTVSVIDTATKTVAATVSVMSTVTPSLPLSWPVRVVVSPNGQFYFVTYSATAGSFGVAGIASFKVSDNSIVDKLEFGSNQGATPSAYPYGIDITSSGQTLWVSSFVSAGAPGAWVKQFPINANGQFGSPATTANIANWPADLALSADDSTLFLTTIGSGGVNIYPTSTMATPTRIPLTGVQSASMIAPAPTRGSQFAYIGSGTSNVYLVGEYVGPYYQELNEVAGTAFSSSALTATGLSGTVTYSISPSLPDGLTFNSATGVISGTITCPLAATTYVITGTNGTSIVTAQVKITVTAGASINPSCANGDSANSATLAATGVDGLQLTIGGLAMLVAGAFASILVRRIRHDVR